MKHYPVMLPEVLGALNPKEAETYIDGTFGNGGYSEAILKAADCTVIGLDRDPNVRPRAQELASAYTGRFELRETPFSKMDELPGLEQVDAVILDIGVSSMQLDQAERGFSFMRSGPLDMRMAQSGPTAADAVNKLEFADLVRIFKVYGEERRAKRAAEFIIRAREEGDIVTTDVLAAVIESALGRTGKIHPATRIFQALRIFVNDELGELYRGLCAAERILKPGGRLIVVSFHSLEDRIVKQFLRTRADTQSAGSRHMPSVEVSGPDQSFELMSRSTVKPSKDELAENPRSRSARLRAAVRTHAVRFDLDDKVLSGMPRLEDYRWAA